MERLGGVPEVLDHPRTGPIAAEGCERGGVQPARDVVWRALVTNDQLACVFAWLLLWKEPAALPVTEQEGFEYCLRNWRPGAWTHGNAAQRAELRAKWGGYWTRADAAVKA